MAQKARKLGGVAVVALLAGLSMGGPSAADCPRTSPSGAYLPKAQVEACEAREAGTEAYADFAEEAYREQMERAEDERRAGIVAALPSDRVVYRGQLNAILQETGSVSEIRDLNGFLNHQLDLFNRRAAPWLYDDVPNPWIDVPEEPGDEDTGGDGTDTGGDGTDTGGDGTDTGGGGTDTGGGGTGGETPPDPDPETDPDTPDDGFDSGGSGSEGPIRVALAPFPGEGVVWQCANFRVLTPQEEEALGAIEGDVSFLANQLVLRGADGVERNMSVQYVSDADGEVILVWPWPNQAALNEVCPG